MKLIITVILVAILTGSHSMQQNTASCPEKTISVTVTQAITVTKVYPYTCMPCTLSCPIHMMYSYMLPISSLINQTIYTTKNSNGSVAVAGGDSTGLVVLGSFTVLLALLLVVTITGWIYTVTLVNRKKHSAINIW